MARIIDLSHTIENELQVYPGDSPTRLLQTKFLTKDHYNNYDLEMGMHTGTHIDIPIHMTKNTKYVCDLPLEGFIGNGCVLDVRGQQTIKFNPAYENIIKKDDFLLLYSGFDEKFGTEEYFKNGPIVDMQFAEFLVQKGIKTLGIDLPSPDRYPFAVHKLLLRNGIYILENLTNLASLIGEQTFEVIALPLKIKADASIVRAVARIY